jgi:uncharacterized protein
MKIAITGASGLIGSALTEQLLKTGNSVTRVSRRGGTGVVKWDPERAEIDAEALEGHDVVIHLAGESVAGMWTPAKKRRILESRVNGTRLLAKTLASLERKPEVLVSASAAGFYGDRAEPVDESSPRGEGLLASVTDAWERETATAADAGIRVVCARFGTVLSGRGGALSPLALLFRLGLGGRLGNGRQPMSWVTLDDVCGAVIRVLGADLAGPVNVVAPGVVTNAEFTRELAAVLHRPAWFPVPELVLRALPGGMGKEMLLWGAHVVPRKLLESGFVFSYPEISGALAHVLGGGHS